VSIGPETSRVARSLGLEIAAEAPTHDLAGLVAAVRDLMKSRP
jgi:uroporphyrinogen-III synthase